jgi:hypothetical protein
MYSGTFFANQRRDDDDDDGYDAEGMIARMRARTRTAATASGRAPPNWFKINGTIPPNRKLMLGMVCFPKKPLYAHHLPILRVLRLHPPTLVRVVSRNPVLA